MSYAIINNSNIVDCKDLKISKCVNCYQPGYGICWIKIFYIHIISKNHSDVDAKKELIEWIKVLGKDSTFVRREKIDKYYHLRVALSIYAPELNNTLNKLLVLL